MTKVLTNFRFSEVMIQALDANAGDGIGHDDKLKNRTSVLEGAFAYYLYDFLKKEKARQKIPEKKYLPRFESALHQFPDGIFELYLEENEKRKSLVVDLLDMDSAILESLVKVFNGKYMPSFLNDEQRELVRAELARRKDTE